MQLSLLYRVQGVDRRDQQNRYILYLIRSPHSLLVSGVGWAALRISQLFLFFLFVVLRKVIQPSKNGLHGALPFFMDVALCAGLATLESLLAFKIDESKAAHGRYNVLLGLFLAQYLALKYYRIFLYHKYISPFRNIPGPTDNHAFFGQAINFIRAKSPEELYVKWMKEYPDAPVIRYLTFANTEVLVCNSLNSFKDVLQTHCYSFHKPDRWRRMMLEITGKGVLSLEDDEHRLHRKMLAGVFSASNVRKLEPVFTSKTQELIWMLDRAASKGSEGVIDCTELFTKATLDIIGETILGVELSSLKSIELGGQIPETQSKPPAGDKTDYTFHEAYEIIFAQSLLGKILFFSNAFVPTRWLPLQANRDFAFATSWLRGVLTRLIHDRYEDLEDPKRRGDKDRPQKTTRDLLSFIVEESMPGRPAEGIDQENLLGHLLQFMAAGHATSADTISWSVYTMATRHDIQDRLRSEITQLVTRKPDFGFPDIDSLPYLDNFIKETLRIYAPSTSHHRQAAADVTIDGVFIPKGTTIDIVPAVPMFNPLVWGENADETDPTRWDRLTPEQRSPFAFEAFSNGPRMCIGKSYALMEIKIILVELIRRFRFVSVENPFTIENPGFALRPNGLEVKIEQIGS